MTSDPGITGFCLFQQKCQARQHMGACPIAIYGSKWWWDSARIYLGSGHMPLERVWSPSEDKECPTATFISPTLPSAGTSGGGWCWRHDSRRVGEPVWLKIRVFMLLCCKELGDLEAFHALTFRKLKCSEQACHRVNSISCLKLHEVYFYFACVLRTSD